MADVVVVWISDETLLASSLASDSSFASLSVTVPSVTVSGGVGSHWSDFAYYEREREITDPETGEVTIETYQQRDRVPGTHDRIDAITGIIHATANGTTIEITIEYQVSIGNIG